MKRLGIVTGLAAEEAIVRRAAASLGDSDSIVHCAGPGPSHAGRAARALVAERPQALLSFGLAGGLDPALPRGTVIVADAVTGSDGAALATDLAWRARLTEAARGLGPRVGRIAGADAPVRGVAEKAALFAATGALAVDMESLAVAVVAREAGIPFLAVRAIADPAWRALPGAAVAALGPDGRVYPMKVLGGLLGRPSEIPALALLACDSRIALGALRRVAGLVPGFGLV